MIIGQCHYDNGTFIDSGNNTTISQLDQKIVITFINKPNKIGLQGDYGICFTINGKNFYLGRSGILEIEGWQIDNIVYSTLSENKSKTNSVLIDYAIIEEE